MNDETLMQLLDVLDDYMRNNKKIDDRYIETSQKLLSHVVSLLQTAIKLDDKLMVAEALNWLDDYKILFRG